MNSRFRAAALAGLFSLLLGALSAADSPAEIRAALASHDRAIHLLDGWVRDPYIIRGPDGFFYYTGTTPAPEEPREERDRYNSGLDNPKVTGSSRPSMVGWHVRVWRSADLVTWESLGVPYTLKDGVWAQAEPERFAALEPAKWHLWAPELHWLGERWALVHTSPAPVNAANFSLSAGRDLKGPWSNPMGTAIGRRHDPSLFRDDDGTWWLIWGATEIAPLQPDFSGFSAEPVRIGPSGKTAKMGHEGCFIRRIDGTYVLFGTGWSTGQMRKGSYNLYFATADKITGPYGERQFAGRFLGHGTLFQDKAGRWWCTAFYNANVPPLPGDGIESRDLAATAQTINPQGLTIVPMEVAKVRGEIRVRALDPRYATPGPDEAQRFTR